MPTRADNLQARRWVARHVGQFVDLQGLTYMVVGLRGLSAVLQGEGERDRLVGAVSLMRLVAREANSYRDDYEGPLAEAERRAAKPHLYEE